MASLEHNLPETFVPGEGTKGEIDLATTHHVKWVVSTGAFSCATPAIAGGKVFLATEKHLIVLAAGKEIKLLSRIDLGAASWVTPVAANGVLYIASKNKTGTA